MVEVVVSRDKNSLLDLISLDLFFSFYEKTVKMHFSIFVFILMNLISIIILKR